MFDTLTLLLAIYTIVCVQMLNFLISSGKNVGRKKMNNGKQNDIDPFLRWHLDTDQIDVPDIPLKRDRFNRLLHYLSSPSRNPIEIYINKTNSLAALASTPIVIGAIFSVAHYFIKGDEQNRNALWIFPIIYFLMTFVVAVSSALKKRF